MYVWLRFLVFVIVQVRILTPLGVTGLEVVGAAAGAFPPAMPVGLIFAACGHLLDVSAYFETWILR